MNSRIKLIEEDEYAAFYSLISENGARLKKYFPNTVKEVTSSDEAKAYLAAVKMQLERRERFLFGIYDHGRLIGYMNIKNFDWDIPKCELGYFIDQTFEGRGIMTLALREALDYCFEKLNVIKIFLRIGIENVGSIRLAEKAGFIKEGTLRKEFRLHTGELIDVEYYGLVNETEPKAGGSD